MKKTIAVLEVDLQTTPLGTQSRLADDLLGRPVLRRTVERLRRARRVQGISVLCPSTQAEQCGALLAGLEVQLNPHDAPPPPWRGLVQPARKWSLDGWRGGIGGTTYFDEFTDCQLIAAWLDSTPADWVLSVPPSAALIDPALTDRMIEHMESDESDSRLGFVQAPPGMVGILLDARLVRELAEKRTPLGWLFSYKPDHVQKDLIFESCCCPTPVEVRHAGGRLLADTQRSTEALTALLSTYPDADAVSIGRWLMERDRTHAGILPREMEIELTTDDPYPSSLVRPRGGRGANRRPMTIEIVRQIAAEMAEFDDSLIVLGGFGDPLRHGDFAAVLDALRPTEMSGMSIYGLAVRTTGVDLTDAAIDALITHRVDVLDVLLDAWTPELYAQLQSPGTSHERADMDAVLRSLDRLADARQRRGSVYPLVVPEFTKVHENVHELDDFYDGWLRRLGAVTISGGSHYARQVEDRSVIKMAPAARGPCRRIQSRCMVLSDGRVTLCDQDVQGRQTIGQLAENSLRELWQGSQFTQIRSAHQQGRFDAAPLCPACDEWHRP